MKKIPVAHIQHDFHECIKDVSGNKLKTDSFFINVDVSPDLIKEYRVEVRPDDNYEVTLEDDVSGNVLKANNVATSKENDEKKYSFKQLSSNCFEADLNGGQSFCFQTLSKDFTDSNFDSQKKSWTSVDSIAVPEKKYCLGDLEGNIDIVDTDFGLIRSFPSAHLGEITVSSFFPSGEVLLSGSSDLRLKIWSLKDGSLLRTFVGHSARITSSAMIDRGRNFISSSKDGSIRLWECGSGKTVKTFTRRENHNDGINSIHLLDQTTGNSLDNATENTNELEFGTQGKQIIAAHESGVITMHDLFCKEQLLQLPSKYTSACTSVLAYPANSNYVYAGYESGNIAHWDIRNNGKCVNEWMLNEGNSINDLHFNDNHLYVSSGYDTSIKFTVDDSNGSVLEDTIAYLSSNDCQVLKYSNSITSAKGVLAVGTQGFCGLYNN